MRIWDVCYNYACGNTSSSLVVEHLGHRKKAIEISSIIGFHALFRDNLYVWFGFVGVIVSDNVSLARDRHAHRAAIKMAGYGVVYFFETALID